MKVLSNLFEKGSKIKASEIAYKDGHGNVRTLQDFLENCAHPIGSIYISTSSTDPSYYLGGTWERYAQGRCLIGIDEKDTDSNFKTNFNKSAGTQVGSKWLHSHDHPWAGVNDGAAINTAYGQYPFRIYQDKAGNWGGTTSYLKPAGSGDSQNIQPGVMVYFFRRIG